MNRAAGPVTGKNRNFGKLLKYQCNPVVVRVSVRRWRRDACILPVKQWKHRRHRFAVNAPASPRRHTLLKPIIARAPCADRRALRRCGRAQPFRWRQDQRWWGRLSARGDASINWAESYFSRLRRAEIGTHHKVAGPYLASYAGEMAWREDARRNSNGAQYLRITRAAAVHPVSRQWKGYWQRRRAA